MLLGALLMSGVTMSQLPPVVVAAVAENADDTVDREQHADEQCVEAECGSIERQHDIDHAVAEPGDAQAGAGDDGVAITLLGRYGRFRLVVLFLYRHPPCRSRKILARSIARFWSFQRAIIHRVSSDGKPARPYTPPG